MNFSNEDKVIDIKDLNLINLETGESINEKLSLEPYGVRIVKKDNKDI